MINYNFYKLFNPELKNYNNNKLLFHWNNIGKNENKICSIEHFFSLYPYFNIESYKLYNKDINLTNNIELMIHWHYKGIHENRICSDIHFKNLYPNYTDDLNIENIDIYQFKNRYHLSNTKYLFSNIITKITKNIMFIIFIDKIDEMNKIEKYEDIKMYIFLNGIKNNNDNIDLIEIQYICDNKKKLVKKFYDKYIDSNIEYRYSYYINNISIINDDYINKCKLNNIKTIKNKYISHNKELLGIIINNNLLKQNNKYYIKALSLMNYHNMNIIIYIEKNSNINNSFLNDIDYIELELNELEYFSLCKYIITDITDIDNYYDYFKNSDKIFYINQNHQYKQNLENIILINADTHTNSDTNIEINGIFVTEYENYILKKNILYRLANISNNILNKINFNNMYVSTTFLNKYDYNYNKIKFDTYSKIIYYNSIDKINNNLNYGLIKYNNKHYLNLYNKYTEIDINIIKYIQPTNLNYIFVKNSDNNQYIINSGYILEFNINVILIVDNDNDFTLTNIFLLTKQNYENYNIIIYLNNPFLNINLIDKMNELKNKNIT